MMTKNLLPKLAWQAGFKRLFMALTLLWGLYVVSFKLPEGSLIESNPTLIIFTLEENRGDLTLEQTIAVLRERMRSNDMTRCSLERMRGDDTKTRLYELSTSVRINTSKGTHVYIDCVAKAWYQTVPAGLDLNPSIVIGEPTITDVEDALDERSFKSFKDSHGGLFDEKGYIRKVSSINSRRIDELAFFFFQIVSPPLAALALYFLAAWCVRGFIPRK